MRCKKLGKLMPAAAFLFLSAALLGGCEDDPAAPQATAPPTVNVTVTVTAVEVIAECEGTTGTNPGDFVFELHFYTSDTSIATQVFSGSFSGLNNETVNIPDIVVELNRAAPEDGRLYLEFRVTELDNNVPDAGMNDARGIGEYGWPTGDTVEDTYVTQVSGSSRCSVAFVYTLGAERR
jgi:hypothetical protein